MRNYLFTIILVLTLPLGELHSFWNHNTEQQNWILNANRPMSIAWNIRMLLNEALPIFYFIAFMFWEVNRLNLIVRMAFLLLAITNVGLYLYDYKQGHYGYIYLWFAAYVLISYTWYRWTNWAFNKLHPPK